LLEGHCPGERQKTKARSRSEKTERASCGKNRRSASGRAPTGTLIGSIISWIVDTFFGWIIGLAQDDIFPPKSIRLRLASAKASYYNAIGLTRENPTPHSYDFIGHGGHYRVWGYFKAYA
jgi:hypothetical protein